MVDTNNFITGSTLPPKDAINRVSRIQANRRLYNNDLKDVLKATGSTLSINLFRKAVDIYVTFLMSEGVKINYNDTVADGNIDLVINHIQDVLYMANTDARRYGVGVITINDNGNFVVYEPDNWHRVIKDGQVSADILLSYSDFVDDADETQKAKPNNSRQVKVITNDYTKNRRYIRNYRMSGNVIGELISETAVVIAGIQVATLTNGYSYGENGISVFDDIKGIVGELNDIKIRVSASIKKNQDPHLVLPTGVFDETDNKKIDIDSKGMGIPVEKDDVAPYYLQWDSKQETVKFQTSELWKAFYISTGIPDIFFTTDRKTGVISGNGLRKIMIPFLGNLNKMRSDNVRLVNMLLVMMDNSRLVRGLPRMPAEKPDIVFDYDTIFVDRTPIDEPIDENGDNVEIDNDE